MGRPPGGNQRELLGPWQSHNERYTALGIAGEARLMTGGIGARLARLEKAKGIGWMYTISGSDEVFGRDDFAPDVWLRSWGHDVGARDLVVLLRRFSSSAAAEPVLVSAQPMS